MFILGVSLREIIRIWVEQKRPILLRYFLVDQIRFTCRERRAILPQGGSQNMDVIWVSMDREVTVSRIHVVPCSDCRTQILLVSNVASCIIIVIYIPHSFAYTCLCICSSHFIKVYGKNIIIIACWREFSVCFFVFVCYVYIFFVQLQFLAAIVEDFIALWNQVDVRYMCVY